MAGILLNPGKFTSSQRTLEQRAYCAAYLTRRCQYPEKSTDGPRFSTGCTMRCDCSPPVTRLCYLLAMTPLGRSQAGKAGDIVVMAYFGVAQAAAVGGRVI